MFVDNGTVVVVKSPSSNSRVFTKTGLADVAGKSLRVIERNSLGDCLCLHPSGSQLVDIDHIDIETYTPPKPVFNTDAMSILGGMSDILRSRRHS